MRSRSPSKRSPVRSKSQARRPRSRSSSWEKNQDRKRKRNDDDHHDHVAHSEERTSLLQGLKLVMSSKELENRLPALKDAILTLQASGESKTQSLPDVRAHKRQDNQEKLTPVDNDSMLLPHDRVVSDFSWLHASYEKESTFKAAQELDDEELFLYGNYDTAQPMSKSSTADLYQNGGQRKQEPSSLTPRTHRQEKPTLVPTQSLGDFALAPPPQVAPSSSVASFLDSGECEKLKKILQSVNLASEPERIPQWPREEKRLRPVAHRSDSDSAAKPAVKEANVLQALESLQSLLQGTKEKRSKTEGSSTSWPREDKPKVCTVEDRRKERRNIVKKMESLMKDQEELMKADGWSFLTPVIGFYCQKCEEFIGDLMNAENHAATHAGNHRMRMQIEKQAAGRLARASPQVSEQRDDWDAHGGPRDLGEGRAQRDAANRDTQGNLVLKEEMRRERMLITVAQDPAALAKPGADQVKDKTPAVGRKDSRKDADDEDGAGDEDEDRGSCKERGKKSKAKSSKAAKKGLAKKKLHKPKKKKSKKKKDKRKS